MLIRCLMCLSTLLCLQNEGSAQPADQFYAGRTLDLVVGFPPGGGYDLFARPVASHLGKHVPGKPAVVLRYMPGAGGILAANYLFNVAPKDGSVLGIISPTATLDSKLTPAAVKYVAAQFNWLGRIGPQVYAAFVWHTANVRTIEQARSTEIVFAATGPGSGITAYPTLTNNVLGTRFKLVLGYRGSAEALLAIERGEVQGHATSLEIVKTAHPDWIADKKVHVLVQYARKRLPALADVPTVGELARNAEEASVLDAVMSSVEIGRTILTPPGVPADRVEALRRAFDRMVADPELAAELQKVTIDVLPMKGEDVGRLVAQVDGMPDALVAKVKAVYGP